MEYLGKVIRVRWFEFKPSGHLDREERKLIAHAVSYKLALSGLGEMKVYILLLDCV